MSLKKGSQEARDYMKSIREMKKTTSNIKYETNKGKKTQKNIIMDLEKETETLPSGDKIIKLKSSKKIDGEPVEQNFNIIKQPEPEPQPEQRKKGRPQKYTTKEEKEKAKRQQTLISNKRRYYEKKTEKKPEPQPVEGGQININKTLKKISRSFKKNISNPIKQSAEQTFNKISDVAQDVKQNIKEYGQAVLYGRKNLPPKVRNILKDQGNKNIKSIQIKRSPVPALLTGALSFFSFGKFGERLEKNFDELFHLFIEITLEDNTRVTLEKNEVINMDVNPKEREKTETENVSTPIPDNLTLNLMLKNTLDYMGENKFYGYSARDNNCQDFIMAVFKSNNIGNETDFSFIKQNTKQLFEGLPYLRKLSNTVTDLGAIVNTITTGAGITEKNYIIQSVIFDKDKFNVMSSKKWLKDNGFKAPKVDYSENTLRFRQIDPKYIEKNGFTEYRVKDLNNSGVKLIIAYRKNKLSNNNINMEGGKIIVHHIVHFSNNDDCCSEDMEGGKIKISKSLKKLGSDIKRGFNKEISKPLQQDVFNPTVKYVTSKKGGLASDVIEYGIPATTAAILGAAGTATGNPMLGVLGSAAGSKLGKEFIAPAVHKATGAGIKQKKFIKGSQEAKDHMAKIRAMRR